jgi:hypothetical protein
MSDDDNAPMLYRELTVEEFGAAADALTDSPFTVISIHMLRHRLCRAYVAGALPRFDALLIHHKNDERVDQLRR